MKHKYLILLVASIAFLGRVNSQTLGNCGNIDFEDGNYGGWIAKEGTIPSGGPTPDPCCPNPGITVPLNSPVNNLAARHTVMSAAGGNDPCGGFPVVPPPISPGMPVGAYSFRLGNNVISNGSTGGFKIQSLETTFTPTVANNVFTYQYAAVLNTNVIDQGHKEKGGPWFETIVLDPNGDTVICTYQFQTANPASGPPPPEWINSTTCGQVVYKPWTTVSLDLIAQVGIPLTIRFTTADCSFGGHYGYAYFNCECWKIKVSGRDTICEGEYSELVAPLEDNATYDWTGPGGFTATGQIIQVTQTGTYVVTITSNQGCVKVADYYVYVNQKPEAKFVVNSVCEGELSIFDDQSTVPDPIKNPLRKWFWDFGNGDTTSVKNPNYTYPDPGTYDVSLIVTTRWGCVDTLILPTRVGDNPIADFTAPPVCLNDSTFFTDLSTINTGTDTIKSWSWNFGEPLSGANNVSSLRNPVHKYLSAGTYNVTLIITSTMGCADTIVKPVYVNPLPQALFTANEPCLGDPTLFTDKSTISSGSISSWSWNFGEPSSGANNISSDQNPSHTYSLPDTFTVLLTVVSDSGCQSSVSKDVIVNPQPVAAFSGMDVCLHKQTCFTDSTTTIKGTVKTYMMDFGDGNTTSKKNDCYTYSAPGTYTVTLTTITDKGCIDKDTVIVNVWPLPVADFSVSPFPTDVNNTTINFTDLSQGGDSGTWHFGIPGEDTLYVPALNPAYTYPNENVPGGLIYEVVLDIVNQYGCPSVAKKPVVINPYWTFYIPDAFSPNGLDAAANETFYGKGIGILEYEMWVFDRWGNQVFHCSVEGNAGNEDGTEGLPADKRCHWDGRVTTEQIVPGLSGEKSQQDVYVWLVYLKDIFYQRHKYIGHVTLVK